MFSNFTIYGNQTEAKNQMLQELAACGMLWFMNTSYKEYLTNNTDVMNLYPIQTTIQSISSSLMIIKNCYITDQLSFISSYLSNVTLDGVDMAWQLISMLSKWLSQAKSSTMLLLPKSLQLLLACS